MVIFFLMIVLLIMVLFVIPKLLQNKRAVPSETQSPKKSQQFQDPMKHHEMAKILDSLFDHKSSENSLPKVTFKIDNTFLNGDNKVKETYMEVLREIENSCEVICLAHENFAVPCMQQWRIIRFSNENPNVSIAAIVRSLKPKFHIDKTQFENLHQHVKVYSWDMIMSKGIKVLLK